MRRQGVRAGRGWIGYVTGPSQGTSKAGLRYSVDSKAPQHGTVTRMAPEKAGSPEICMQTTMLKLHIIQGERGFLVL